MIEIVPKETCCGCEACFVTCPVEAIKMQEDEEGFLYPIIDANRCIECKQCIQHCPVYIRSKDK